MSTTSESDGRAKKAGLFDIRNIIGALMALYGVILALAGLLGEHEPEKTGGVNANLWTGIGLLVVLWPAVAFIGYIVAAIWLGEWLLGRRSPEAAPAERPYAAATIGLIVAFILGLIPVVAAILSILGLGAVVLASWRTLRGGMAQPRIQTQPAAIG